MKPSWPPGHWEAPFSSTHNKKLVARSQSAREMAVPGSPVPCGRRPFPSQSCRPLCIFITSAQRHLWLRLHGLQVLQRLHSDLSILLVARPVWAGGGTQRTVGSPADRDGAPKGTLLPQKPLAGRAAGREYSQRAAPVGSQICSPGTGRCSGQGFWSWPSNEQQPPQEGPTCPHPHGKGQGHTKTHKAATLPSHRRSSGKHPGSDRQLRERVWVLQTQASTSRSPSLFIFPSSSPSWLTSLSFPAQAQLPAGGCQPPSQWKARGSGRPAEGQPRSVNEPLDLVDKRHTARQQSRPGGCLPCQVWSDLQKAPECPGLLGSAPGKGSLQATCQHSHHPPEARAAPELPHQSRA